MPPVPSLIIASAILRSADLSGGVQCVHCSGPAFILAIFFYGSMHYAIHAWNPPLNGMKASLAQSPSASLQDEHKGFCVEHHHLGPRVRHHVRSEKEQKEDKEKVKN